MRKLFLTISVIALGFFFVACGGGGSDDSGSVTLKGKITDGPIYGATVKVVDANDVSNVLAETQSDEDGNFEVDVDKLAGNYMLLADGGQDMGVDGEANANDENSSFQMKAIVNLDENEDEVTANVTPATTVVANIVEDTNLSVDEAEYTLKEAFGIEDNKSLTQIDPTTNDIINKLGNFLALLSKSIPSNDKDLVFKSISKIVIKKEIKVKITNLDVIVKSLNLTDIANGVQEISPDAISQDDIEKLTKTSVVITEQLKITVKNLKTVKSITKAEQKEVLSYKIAFNELLNEINATELDSLDVDKLGLYTDTLQTTMKSVLDARDLNDSSPENIELLSDIVKVNLDKDADSLSPALIQILDDYKSISIKIKTKTTLKAKIRLKKIVKNIYIQTDISKLENIKNVTKSLTDETVIDELDNSASEIEEVANAGDYSIKDELQEELEQTLAGQVATDICENKGSITPKLIKAKSSKSFKNKTVLTGLKQTLKIKIDIKIKSKKLKKGEKLSRKDKAKYFASTQTIKSLKLTIKIKKDISLTSFNALYDATVTKADKAYEQKIDDLKAELEALQMSFVDLSQTFNSTTFNQTIVNNTTIINNINEGKGTIKDKIKIKIDIKIKIKVKIVVSGNFVKAEEIEEEIEELPLFNVRRIKFTLPRLEGLPTEHSGKIEFKIKTLVE